MWNYVIRASTLTPSNGFGINLNTYCEPGLNTRHLWPPSLTLLWLDGIKSKFNILVEILYRGAVIRAY